MRYLKEVFKPAILFLIGIFCTCATVTAQSSEFTSLEKAHLALVNDQSGALRAIAAEGVSRLKHAVTEDQQREVLKDFHTLKEGYLAAAASKNNADFNRLPEYQTWNLQSRVRPVVGITDSLRFQLDASNLNLQPPQISIINNEITSLAKEISKLPTSARNSFVSALAETVLTTPDPELLEGQIFRQALKGIIGQKIDTSQLVNISKQYAESLLIDSTRFNANPAVNQDTKMAEVGWARTAGYLLAMASQSAGNNNDLLQVATMVANGSDLYAAVASASSSGTLPIALAFLNTVGAFGKNQNTISDPHVLAAIESLSKTIKTEFHNLHLHLDKLESQLNNIEADIAENKRINSQTLKAVYELQSAVHGLYSKIDMSTDIVVEEDRRKKIVTCADYLKSSSPKPSNTQLRNCVITVADLADWTPQSAYSPNKLPPFSTNDYQFREQIADDLASDFAQKCQFDTVLQDRVSLQYCLARMGILVSLLSDDISVKNLFPNGRLDTLQSMRFLDFATSILDQLIGVYGSEEFYKVVADYASPLNQVRQRLLGGQQIAGDIKHLNSSAISSLLKKVAYAHVNSTLRGELQLLGAGFTERALNLQEHDAECRLVQASIALAFVPMNPCYEIPEFHILNGIRLAGLNSFVKEVQNLVPVPNNAIRFYACIIKDGALPGRQCRNFGWLENPPPPSDDMPESLKKLILESKNHQLLNEVLPPTFAPIVTLLRHFQPPYPKFVLMDTYTKDDEVPDFQHLEEYRRMCETSTVTVEVIPSDCQGGCYTKASNFSEKERWNIFTFYPDPSPRGWCGLPKLLKIKDVIRSIISPQEFSYDAMKGWESVWYPEILHLSFAGLASDPIRLKKYQAAVGWGETLRTLIAVLTEKNLAARKVWSKLSTTPDVLEWKVLDVSTDAKLKQCVSDIYYSKRAGLGTWKDKFRPTPGSEVDSKCAGVILPGSNPIHFLRIGYSALTNSLSKLPEQVEFNSNIEESNTGLGVGLPSFGFPYLSNLLINK